MAGPRASQQVRQDGRAAAFYSTEFPSVLQNKKEQ